MSSGSSTSTGNAGAKIRSRAKQGDILEQIADRLVDQIDELTPDNCFLAEQPIPLSMPTGLYCVTVSLGPSQFPHEFFEAAGVDQLVDDASVVITPIVAVQGDQPRKKWRRVVGNTEGTPAFRGNERPSLLYFKESVLRALLYAADWEPELDNQLLLRDQLSAVSSDAPHDVRVGEAMCAAMEMRFKTVFDWDLA